MLLENVCPYADAISDVLALRLSKQETSLAKRSCNVSAGPNFWGAKLLLPATNLSCSYFGALENQNAKFRPDVRAGYQTWPNLLVGKILPPSGPACKSSQAPAGEARQWRPVWQRRPALPGWVARSPGGSHDPGSGPGACSGFSVYSSTTRIRPTSLRFSVLALYFIMQLFEQQAMLAPARRMYSCKASSQYASDNTPAPQHVPPRLASFLCIALCHDHRPAVLIVSGTPQTHCVCGPAAVRLCLSIKFIYWSIYW